MPKYISADGRSFTDYRQNCRMNETVQSGSGMNNTREYRAYLQQNAEKIISLERAKATTRHKLGCLCSGCSRVHKNF